MERENADVAKEDMRRLLSVVRELRKISPRMELGQLAVLLEVLTDPGVWARDLSSRVGVTTAALSRNVLALSQTSYIQDSEGEARQGLDLIIQNPDPTDGRAHQLMPTCKGTTLAKTLSILLRG